MKKILFFGLLLALTLISCKKSSSPVVENKPTTQAKTFEAIPMKFLEKVAKECDYTDFIFHKLPFAMSQSEKAGILGNLNYISMEAQTTIPVGCKPIARQMWHSGGDIFLEFDVYFSDGCHFYTMVENEKPLYACKMTEVGVKFYSQMIDRALDASSKM